MGGRWVKPTYIKMYEAVTSKGAYVNKVKEGYGEQYK